MTQSDFKTEQSFQRENKLILFNGFQHWISLRKGQFKLYLTLLGDGGSFLNLNLIILEVKRHFIFFHFTASSNPLGLNKQLIFEVKCQMGGIKHLDNRGIVLYLN